VDDTPITLTGDYGHAHPIGKYEVGNTTASLVRVTSGSSLNEVAAEMFGTGVSGDPYGTLIAGTAYSWMQGSTASMPWGTTWGTMIQPPNPPPQIPIPLGQGSVVNPVGNWTASGGGIGFGPNILAQRAQAPGNGGGQSGVPGSVDPNKTANATTELSGNPDGEANAEREGGSEAEGLINAAISSMMNDEFQHLLAYLNGGSGGAQLAIQFDDPEPARRAIILGALGGLLQDAIDNQKVVVQNARQAVLLRSISPGTFAAGGPDIVAAEARLETLKQQFEAVKAQFDAEGLGNIGITLRTPPTSPEFRTYSGRGFEQMKDFLGVSFGVGAGGIEATGDEIILFDAAAIARSGFRIGARALARRSAEVGQIAPKTAGEFGLKDILKQASGWSPGQAGDYFGWVGRGVTKSAKDFTKSDLLQKGFTKDALEKMAQAYEAIAKLSSAAGNVNPSAASRAAQIREILKELF